jgi:hypothetical protein
MEMSPAYLEATARHLQQAGWTLVSSTENRERDGELKFICHRHRVERAVDEVLVLEALTYPDGVQAYYLAIEEWHGITCTSFPLDSWKHRADRVEFKFYSHPSTNLGLSFIIRLAGGA